MSWTRTGCGAARISCSSWRAIILRVPRAALFQVDWATTRSALYRVVAPICFASASSLLVAVLFRQFVALRQPLHRETCRLAVRLLVHPDVDACDADHLHAVPVRAGPPTRRRLPFAFSLLLVAGAAVVMLAAPLLWSEHATMRIRVDAWLYAYLLGWAAYFARTRGRKALVVALALILTSLEYGVPSSREIILPLGLGVALFVRDVPLPRRIADVVLSLAAASYFIYLTHVFVWHAILLYAADLHMPAARIGLMWLGAVAGGLIFAAALGFHRPGDSASVAPDRRCPSDFARKAGLKGRILPQQRPNVPFDARYLRREGHFGRRIGHAHALRQPASSRPGA